MKKISVLFFCLLFLSSLTIAQEQYGNIRGVVLDVEGNPLPGVTVTLDSDLYSDRAMISSEGGVFRFLNLATGKCSVKCELSGFKTFIQENIIIQVGSNIDLKVTMELTSLEEEVTVVAESPVIDMKRTGASMNVTQEMLQEVPSARDPWAVLKQVPGVLVTRENVGGSESGFQSGFMAKGAWSGWNMYNMDGIPITDMAALGSPRYYDFDSFEEMQIVTSGQDASMQTGGVSINFITRRGNNKFQVVGRAFFTNDKLQADNRTQELIDKEYVGDQIDQILDYGLQVGGPIIKDKMWFWLGYGAQDIRRLTIAGVPERTELGGINTKINFSISRKNKAEVAFVRYEKSVDGRGAGLYRPTETTVDQGSDGSPFLKIEDTHYFSDNFLLTAKIAYNWSKFWLDPKGGIDVQAGYDLGTYMWSGSASYYVAERPSLNVLLDGNYFIEDVLGGDHEFKFGVEYRKTTVYSNTVYPADTLKYYRNGNPQFARIYREGVWDYGSDRYSIYLNDIYTRGRLTLKLGLRLDREKSVCYETSVNASRIAPDFLQALTLPAIDPGVVWLTFSPRLGFTYDLTGDGKTLIRGNIARYGVHSPAWVATQVTAAGTAYATYYWFDPNGDDFVTTDELIGYPTAGVFGFSGFDPWNPTKLESPYGIDTNLKSPYVDEILIGIERELIPDFSLSATFTYRLDTRYMWYPYYDKETGAIESKDSWTGPIKKSLTVDGTIYDYEYWTLKQYRYAGDYMTNQPDAFDRYTGIEFVATKRLSHRWMMNASFTLQRFIWSFGENGYNDPTNVAMWEGGADSGLNANWIAKVSFLYQLPWGFNFSCFANARQGYPNTQRLNVSTPERAAVGIGGSMNILLERPGTTRLPNFYSVDLSLVKDFKLGKFGQVSLQIDAFNALNSAHVLGRNRTVNSPGHGETTSILNPRVIRFGIRYRF
jgi:hypothetical protein